ncbi:hypothetical protein [Streptomyces griseiscabiei]|uniref:DNA-binding protein n=1 Tax=Streptomyces griseiscabiei TaxID=2993540 RepID=A0ABU4KXF7_9ACTN|nr:hypothetical protein [Streptomyces griseiscabiei]MBZ3904388.1 hypothetical protein [Streptomyces griseiscabiei]MDX2908135.1 hypothetical protein [Streptomyces griseiscabiei]
MAEVRVPFLLGHAEIAFLFHVERQTSQRWRTEGTLDEPDLIASGNPYWLLSTILRLDGEGDRAVDRDRLATYKAGVPLGYDLSEKERLPVVVGIQEAARVLGQDAQAISRWRNRQRIADADLLLSGSPLWLLETILDDGRQRQRPIVASEVTALRAGQRPPQKPRGRRLNAPVTRLSRQPPPAAQTFTNADHEAAAEFLASILAQGYSVTITPQP